MNDAIPDSLVRYQGALEEAIRRDLAGAPARRRRRVGIRFALAVAATAAAGLGALNLLVRGAPSPAAPADAAILRHAAAALAQTPGTILHIRFTATQDNGDGTSVSWSQESFSEQVAPYDTRMINSHLPGTPAGVEQATVSGVSQLYDPTRNTIYIGPAPSNADANDSANARRYHFSPGPAPGTYRVRVPVAYRLSATGSAKHRAARVPAQGNPGAVHLSTVWRTLTVTAAQARALRDGADTIVSKVRGKGRRITAPRVVRASTASGADAANSLDPFSATFRGQILALLRSGRARVVGHATVSGSDTIEIRAADGNPTYYVAPGSYTPVELTTRGTTGGTVMRFESYEELPMTENGGLLSLTAQHPGAVVDRNAGDYRAAEARLFPHG